MNARRAPVAGLVALTIVVCIPACSAGPEPDGPNLQATGSEAAVAVTVPGGAEALPSWVRRPADASGPTGESAVEQATLTVPSDLLFATDSADLAPASVPVLAQVAAEFESRPAGSARIQVEGHADSDGEAAYNQLLSERRASAVADWLAAHGVPRSALTAVGLGESRPAVPEDNEAAKAANRRVVITVG